MRISRAMIHIPPDNAPRSIYPPGVLAPHILPVGGLPIPAEPHGNCYERHVFYHVAISFNKTCDAACKYCSQKYAREHDTPMDDDELLRRLDRALMVFALKFPYTEFAPTIVGGDVSTFSDDLLFGIKQRFRYFDSCEYMTHNREFDMKAENWKGTWHILDWVGKKGLTLPTWMRSCNIVIEQGQMEAAKQFKMDNPDLENLYMHPCFDIDYKINHTESQAVSQEELDEFRDTGTNCCEPSISIDLTYGNIMVYSCCFNPTYRVQLEKAEPMTEERCNYAKCELHRK